MFVYIKLLVFYKSKIWNPLFQPIGFLIIILGMAIYYKIINIERKPKKEIIKVKETKKIIKEEILMRGK